ncbi:hypothetical protein [Maridesulfovibrio sp.]|uniref:hypothetical protein n=1 Tax=Maridesulfovibrio sp. TaxID=2795000 RepID=UPI002A188B84|nr:hypothetical protein [Maridesulfovibrio sp.]
MAKFDTERIRTLEEVLRRLLLLYSITKGRDWEACLGDFWDREDRFISKYSYHHTEFDEPATDSDLAMDYLMGLDDFEDIKLPLEEIKSVFRPIFGEVSDFITPEEIQRMSQVGEDSSSYCDPDFFDAFTENDVVAQPGFSLNSPFEQDGDDLFLFLGAGNAGTLREDLADGVSKIPILITPRSLNVFNKIMSDFRQDLIRMSDFGINIVERKSESIETSVYRKTFSFFSSKRYYKKRYIYTLAINFQNMKGDDTNIFGTSQYLPIRDSKPIFPTVDDVFSGVWRSLASFTVSVLVSYFYLCKTYKKIRVCSSCQSLFLPKKYYEDGGKYCSESCRYKLKINVNELKCYKRHVKYYMNRIDTVKDHMRKYPEGKYKNIYIPAIPSSDICKVDKCPEGEEKPNRGRCGVFMDVFSDVAKAYDEIKLCSKRN